MRQFDERLGMIVGDATDLPPAPTNDAADIVLKPSDKPVGRIRAGAAAVLICLAGAIGRFKVVS